MSYIFIRHLKSVKVTKILLKIILDLGEWLSQGQFVAERILAKHDENYMPPELKESMKQNAK